MSQRCAVIIGAGPTGAALSFLLARRGVQVVLVEREPTFDRIFRGEALMPSGIDAIRQMGLMTELDGLPHVTVPCMELYVDRRRVMRADWPEVSGANAARAISQPALLSLLVDRAAATGSCVLRAGATLHAIEVAPTHVDVTIRSAAGEETLRADVAIGADGRASTTRALAGIGLQRDD
jgi:2-polyprenyl-6-methoxyphenol hydroxylase-like FAD-dependent oxidoreductase